MASIAASTDSPNQRDKIRMVAKLEDFLPDQPWTQKLVPFREIRIPDQIEGVVIRRLHGQTDERGALTVLGTSAVTTGFQTPHVYLVQAAPGSVRAWVYHERQSDCLAYTNGSMKIVLYDLRPDSPTYLKLNVLKAGASNKIELTIPPFVAHGVQNCGSEEAFFINMPTRAYDPADPDKARLPKNNPRIPYAFE